MSEAWSPRAGEIIWLDFTPTEGSEQSGRRPALVVSDDGYNAATGRAVVLPITGRTRGWPFETALPPRSAVQGAVLVDQVRCVDWRARFAKPAGAAPAAVLADARGKLAALTLG
ncbi:MAG: type II toxin-antitoxin system PemK/MazF family toxin [Caulobacteraceae bacterium]|nr:type II toxin-antitoxin system PemK/MazF family toxin [Caulobacteraceae bacterium]